MAEPSKWRRPWLIAVGVTVVVGVAASIVALAAAGESPTAEPTPTPTPTPTEPATPERPAPVLQPLALAPEPTWSSEESFEAPGADKAVVRDGLALVTGPNHLLVLDVATGEVRWSLEDGEDLDGDITGAVWNPTRQAPPRLVATEDGLAVPVEYHRPTNDDVGIALLSAEDGSTVWQRSTGTAPDTKRVLWAVDDRVALTTAATKEGSLTTIAVDINTGEERWEAAEVWPAAIAGDTALTISSAESLEDPWSVAAMPLGDLAGVDLLSGEPRWELDDRFGRTQVVLTAGAFALLQAPERDVPGIRHVFVDAAGEVLGTLVGHVGCATDGTTLIACPVGYEEVRVLDLASREITVLPGDGDSWRLDSVAAGRVILRDDLGFHSLDRFGNRIDESLPSGVAASSDTHVLFHAVRDDNHHVISLHPLAG